MRRETAGRQGGQLLLAAGVFTLVNNYLPGSSHLHLPVLNTVGVLAVVLGAVCLRVPWGRLPPRAPLVVLAVALTLLAVAGTYGEVSPYSYAVYYVVVFVWVGIAQPPRTAYWVSPVAALAYVVPFLVRDDELATAFASVTVAIPVCVLVAEVLARQVAGLERGRAELRERVTRVERLAEACGDLGRDLDEASVQRRLVARARELFDARAALLTAGGVVVAVDGPPGSTVQAPATADAEVQGRLAVVARTGSPGPGAERADGPVLDGPVLDGQRVHVPCDSGALHLVLDEGPGLEPEDLDLLRLLATQGTAALANARTHAEAVAQGAHEQAVVDVLADGVLVLDTDGVVTSCNEAAAALLGVPRSALVGSVPLLEVGAPGVALHHLVGARWVETVATVLGATGERVVALRDVSRHRALDEAKDLFLATTSHELRTPLTAIKGYLHVLQRRWDRLDDARRLSALATVAERTDALVALTDHLLLGARASASRHSSDPRPFELSDALAASLRSFAGLSPRHRLEVHLPSAPLVALGDPSSVQHIVGQLVENAVKYSPDGGTVALRARQDGALAVVEVSDEGVGIPEGVESALFAPFFQAGDTNTREYGGVGLGLYIVRQLVEAQNGTVSVANRPDGGTVVRFTLPLVEEPVALPGRAEAS